MLVLEHRMVSVHQTVDSLLLTSTDHPYLYVSMHLSFSEHMGSDGNASELSVNVICLSLLSLTGLKELKQFENYSASNVV